MVKRRKKSEVEFYKRKIQVYFGDDNDLAKLKNIVDYLNQIAPGRISVSSFCYKAIMEQVKRHEDEFFQ